MPGTNNCKTYDHGRIEIDEAFDKEELILTKEIIELVHGTDFDRKKKITEEDA